MLNLIHEVLHKNTQSGTLNVQFFTVRINDMVFSEVAKNVSHRERRPDFSQYAFFRVIVRRSRLEDVAKIGDVTYR